MNEHGIPRPGTCIGEPLKDGKGRYEVEATIGEGAFGLVFRGRDRKMRKPVAIKHLKSAARIHRDTWGRFMQEAAILADIQHPNIVQIFDRDDEGDWIVLEFAAGGSLDALLKRARKLPADRAIELTVQVLRALAVVHKKCIYHRDLKPENILLDGSGNVKVSDFGIAHAPDDSTLKLVRTQTGATLGTLCYMSPEQLRGEPIDEGMDIWAVGAILYQLVAGLMHLPFWTIGDDVPMPMVMLRVHELIVKTPVRPPSQWNPEVPRALEVIILRALEKERSRRYATADQMADELTAVLRTLPTPGAVAQMPTQYAEPATPGPGERRDAKAGPPERGPVERKAPPAPPAPPPPAGEPNVPEAPSGAEADALARALKALSDKRIDAAVELLGPWASAESPNVHTALAYADACLQTRDYAKAADVLGRACLRADASSRCFELRALCLGRLGRPSEAVAVYREGCVRHARDAALREALAIALRNAGAVDEAMRVLDEAARLEPDRPSVRRLARAWGKQR